MRLGHVNRSVKNMFTRYRLSPLPSFGQSSSPRIPISRNNLSKSNQLPTILSLILFSLVHYGQYYSAIDAHVRFSRTLGDGVIFSVEFYTAESSDARPTNGRLPISKSGSYSGCRAK